MNGPSPHLLWSELGCKSGVDYPHVWRADRAVALAEAFEAVRQEYGAPIRILSAYRTPERNKAVGGAPASQHMEGRALDLTPVSGRALKALIVAVEQVARQGRTKIKGIGFYPTFIHIDTRPSKVFARWHGSRKEADKS